MSLLCTNSANEITKMENLFRLVQIISDANLSLDIGLCYVFHKPIVELLIKKQHDGVKIRLLMAESLLTGQRRKIIRKYVSQMKNAGIAVEMIPVSLTNENLNLIVLVDYPERIDEGNRAMATLAVFACDKVPGELNVVSTVEPLAQVRNRDRCNFWRKRFLRMWGDFESQSDD